MADNVAIYLQKGFSTLKHLVLTKSSYMRNPLMTTRHQDPRRDSFFNINLEKISVFENLTVVKGLVTSEFH